MKIVATGQRVSQRSNLDNSMIPAINIVFLLLIFFMLAGHIETRDEQLRIPASSSDSELNPGELEIKVSASGDYRINGHSIDGDLQSTMAGLGLSPQTVVLCHIHRDLPSSALDPIILAVQKHGIKTLQIATEHTL
ncbi:ExbD/TolR family protein [Amphritea pacifica]|uniref:ExbD/TolR family protein n=1 Tax=Amphritea pacifica TaxID=2811233 RepID=UPI0019668EB5|nr:biopolymer transporter ExbD [Amphritea pacifica]MBN1006528.1 biopolymer transporter ExbD [Amphritea pacifica]